MSVDFVCLWKAERTLEQIKDKTRSLRSKTDDDEQSDSLCSAGGDSSYLLVSALVRLDVAAESSKTMKEAK